MLVYFRSQDFPSVNPKAHVRKPTAIVETVPPNCALKDSDIEATRTHAIASAVIRKTRISCGLITSSSTINRGSHRSRIDKKEKDLGKSKE